MKKPLPVDGEFAEKADAGQSKDDLLGAGKAGGVGQHPSRSLASRAQGFGIAAGYERPIEPRAAPLGKGRRGMYGTLPHAGYYGVGIGARPFRQGQAGFADELAWYHAQYGEHTSGFDKPKKS